MPKNSLGVWRKRHWPTMQMDVHQRHQIWEDGRSKARQQTSVNKWAETARHKMCPWGTSITKIKGDKRKDARKLTRHGTRARASITNTKETSNRETQAWRQQQSCIPRIAPPLKSKKPDNELLNVLRENSTRTWGHTWGIQEETEWTKIRLPTKPERDPWGYASCLLLPLPGECRYRNNCLQVL